MFRGDMMVARHPRQAQLHMRLTCGGECRCRASWPWFLRVVMSELLLLMIAVVVLSTVILLDCFVVILVLIIFSIGLYVVPTRCAHLQTREQYLKHTGLIRNTQLRLQEHRSSLNNNTTSRTIAPSTIRSIARGCSVAEHVEAATSSRKRCLRWLRSGAEELNLGEYDDVACLHRPGSYHSGIHT